MELKKKELTYKGKKVEELKEIGVREFAQLVRSRERRNMLRNFQSIEDFISRAQKKLSKNKQVKTHLRTIVIVPQMIGMRISVYNGREFIPMDITIEMLGHKLGEFAPTRARIKHSKSGVGATKGSRAKSKK